MPKLVLITKPSVKVSAAQEIVKIGSWLLSNLLIILRSKFADFDLRMRFTVCIVFPGL